MGDGTLNLQPEDVGARRMRVLTYEYDNAESAARDERGWTKSVHTTHVRMQSTATEIQLTPPRVVDVEQQNALTALLMQWVEHKWGVVAEHSSDLCTAANRLIIEAKRRCEEVGIEWTDSLVPEHVMEIAMGDQE